MTGESYRPDIDGLRAVAVLSVLIYHFNGASFLPGGFLGVDVFFVISGFLITQRLAAEIGAGNFSLLAFYDRRLRRIMPALLVMLAITLLFGRFILIPGDYSALAQSSAAAALGASNFYFLFNTGYFDQAAGLMPLLHTWSLAVEEQFYLVWPLLLFLIATRRARHDIAAIVVTLTLAGFALALAWHEIAPKSSFYMALPRAFELLIGAALVFLPRLPRKVGEAAIVSGTAAIVASLCLVGEPSPAALLGSCLGSALILWPRTDPATTARWLGALAPVGLISYSLYLWHWPIWVYFRVYINNAMPGPRETTTLAAVSILAAVLSYRFVEQPFRRRRLAPAGTVLASLSVASVVFCAAMYVDGKDGLPQRLDRDAYGLRSLVATWEWPCDAKPLHGQLTSTCTFGADWSTAPSKAVLWGDSNAAHLAPLLEETARTTGIAVALYGACAPILGGTSVRDRRKLNSDYNLFCRQTRADLFDFLVRNETVRTVILSASWQVASNTLAPAGSTESAVDPGSLLEAGLAETLEDLARLGRRVVVIATVPQWEDDPLPCAMLQVGLLRRPCRGSERDLTAAYYWKSHQTSLAALRRLAAQRPDVTFFFPGDALCRERLCTVRLNGEFLYRDAAHLRRNLSESTNRDLAKMTGLDRILTGYRTP